MLKHSFLKWACVEISSASASRRRELLGFNLLADILDQGTSETYQRQYWQCDTEFRVTDRTPLLFRSFHQTSAMICRHVERRTQTVRSTAKKQTKQKLRLHQSCTAQRGLGGIYSSQSIYLASKTTTGTANLLKLVHPEDAASVSAMRAHFLSEAGGEAGVADGKVLGFEPFVSEEGSDGLFWSCNQVLLVDGTVVGLLAALADDLMDTRDDEETGADQATDSTVMKLEPCLLGLRYRNDKETITTTVLTLK